MLDRRQRDSLQRDSDSNRESHRLLARHERSLPALAHALPAVVHSAQLPSQTGRVQSSSPATPRGCSRPQIASSRLKRRARAPSSRLEATRIYCGRLFRYGSSSSESTRGVGRDKAPGVLSPSVFASVCLIFNVVSTSTNSLSEMLVTRKRPPITSPLYTFSMSLLFRSCTSAMSAMRLSGLMMPM